ncbi:sodium-coupled neutral amino acid symporter 2 isoform 2-T2 [Chlamydotis macqueenii]
MHPTHLLNSVMFANSSLGRFISLLWLNSSPFFPLLKKVPGVANTWEGAWRQAFLTVPSSEKNSKSIALQEGKGSLVGYHWHGFHSGSLVPKIEWYLNGDYLVLLVSVILILPLSLLKNLGYLGYTSGFSLLCMVFFLIVVIWKMFQIPCPMDNDIMNMTLINVTLAPLVDENITSDDMCKPKYFIFNSQTVYAVPILTFSFVCHPAILPIYEELKSRSRKRMMNVSYVSFFAMFLMYLLAALFGYLTFYGNVEPELLHTYSAYLGADILLLIVRLAVLMAVTLTVPVVIFPIRSSITQLLWAGKEFKWWRHCSITVALLAFTNVLVIFVPTIRDIFGFIGASAAAMLIFILPSAFYIKLVKKEPMKSVQKIGAALFFLSGILVMIGCMTLIILDWTQNVASDGH